MIRIDGRLREYGRIQLKNISYYTFSTTVMFALVVLLCFFGQDESSVVAFDEEHQLITLCCKFFVHMVARLFFSAHSFRLHYEGGLSGGLPVWELHC